MTTDTLTAGRPPGGASRPSGATGGGPDDVSWTPRLVAGLVIVELPDGLLVEGGAERRVLRGRAAVSLMPRLLAAIDGTRTVNDLAATLNDVPSDHIRRAVHLLRSLGLIEEAGSEIGRGPLAGYVGRLIGTATGRRHSGDALRRLDEAEVVVVADELPARLLAHQLDNVGVGETSAVPHAALLTRRLALGPWPDLVVIVDGSLDLRSLRRFDQNCARAGVGWLRTAINPAGGELGPLFGPDEALCYRCYLTQSNAEVPRKAVDPLIIDGWAALVAIEVMYLLAGIGSSVTAGQVTIFDLEHWEDRRITVRPDPACLSCSHPPCGPSPDRSPL
jgi:hypothetical protein